MDVMIVDHSRRHSYQFIDLIPTLEAHMGTGGNNIPMLLIDNNKQKPTHMKIYDARGNGNGYVAPTVTGDHNGHINDYMAVAVIALEGNGIRPSHQGSGYSEDGKMFTLNTIEKHAVCYGISPFASNAMLSPNPHSGIYEATTSRTLDLNGGNPTCNQGGVVVVVENKTPALVFKERAGKPGGGKGILIGEDKCFTLATNPIEAVCYECGRI